MMKTQKEVRDGFWNEYPQFKRIAGKTQNDYPVDIRVTFCGYVESLLQNNEISEKLADKVTL